MLEMLVGAALRSLLLAAAVGLGLTACRTRNPHVRLMAWTVVLVVSLLMPAITRLCGLDTSRHRNSRAACDADGVLCGRWVGGGRAAVSIRRISGYERPCKSVYIHTVDGGTRPAPARAAALHRDIRHIDRAADRGARVVVEDHAVSNAGPRTLDRRIRRTGQPACHGTRDVRICHSVAK